ncbi:hypothetical protein B0T16DRAFT_462806 [Cercophora newfieldiana]|uniref:Uncharacterized protein n=1 Tax=Cercophora newfieldiana TaxID=92897 RepID=A0AA39XT00_9PEZI|nr:hypothetical protein B0T16DRAFT_462806 [Cercophora newfieldiana]
MDLQTQAAHKFKDVPVLFNAIKHTKGESIPPTAKNKLKFSYKVSVTNKVYHMENGSKGLKSKATRYIRDRSTARSSPLF